MRFTPTAVDGAYIVDLEPRTDERGFFTRAWCAEEFARQGLVSRCVQINMSQNHRAGTVRGMHLQRAPHAESKLVRAIRGVIFDVVLDLRPASPSFKRWAGVELSADNRRALFVPEGCAHGFQSLVDDAELLYQVSTAYAPGAEYGVRFDDPAFGIVWPLPVSVISPKDAAWPDFAV